MKKSYKKALCIGLVSAMTLSLCSCGKATISKQEEEARKLASKEGVFREEVLDVGLDFNEVGLMGSKVVDNQIKILYQVYETYSGGVVEEVMPRDVEEVITEEATEEVALEADVAVNDVAIMLDDDMMVDPGFGVVGTYTGPQYHYMTYDLETKAKSDVLLESDYEVKDGLNLKDYNGWINNVTFGDDGNLYAVKEIYYEDYSDPDNYIYEQYYYLICWDTQGNIKWAASLTDDESGNMYFYTRAIITDAVGNVSVYGYEGDVISIDTTGNVTSRNKMDRTLVENAGLILPADDGKLQILSYNYDDNTRSIDVYNPNTETIETSYELPESLYNCSFFPGKGFDFVVTHSTGLSTYNIGDADKKAYMNFINSDLAISYFDNVMMIDENRFIAQYYDSIDWTLKLGMFTYVDPSTIVDKEIITLAGMYINNNIVRDVIDFNKTNEKYRITVKSYNEYNTMDDYMQGYTKLNNDIISGQVPDILVTNTQMNILNYANKGVLADLNKLLEEDEELSQNEYLTNAWSSYNIDGKLYNIFPSFSIQTFMAKKTLVGDKMGWTTAEFLDLINKMPEDTKAFGYDMTQLDFLNTMMTYCATDFIDLEKGVCSFDSDAFKQILEYAKTLPKEFTDEYWNEYWENYDYNEYNLRYRSGQTLLLDAYIGSIRDLNYQIKGLMGETVSFVGFPSADASGHIITPDNAGFSISAKTPYMDGAWEFVRKYFTKEAQMELEYTLPVLKEAFVESAKLGTQKPFWINENGEKVEYDNTFDLNGEQIVLDPFTQEEVDQICDFIYTVTDVAYSNTEIINIITEEAQAYFENKKSVDEVTKIIQSRVQVYVDETQ